MLNLKTMPKKHLQNYKLNLKKEQYSLDADTSNGSVNKTARYFRTRKEMTRYTHSLRT